MWVLVVTSMLFLFGSTLQAQSVPNLDEKMLESFYQSSMENGKNALMTATCKLAYNLKPGDPIHEERVVLDFREMGGHNYSRHADIPENVFGKLFSFNVVNRIGTASFSLYAWERTEMNGSTYILARSRADFRSAAEIGNLSIKLTSETDPASVTLMLSNCAIN